MSEAKRRNNNKIRHQQQRQRQRQRRTRNSNNNNPNPRRHLTSIANSSASKRTSVFCRELHRQRSTIFSMTTSQERWRQISNSNSNSGYEHSAQRITAHQHSW